jgi:cobalt-zinc-cadmium efflux system membrane fusion protein
MSSLSRLPLARLLLSGVLLVACGRLAPHAETRNDKAADGHDAHAEGAGGTAEPAAEADREQAGGDASLHLDGVRGVRFAAAPEPSEEGAWFAAEAESDAEAEAAVSSSVAGRVTRIVVRPGTALRRGEAILEITSPELADLKAAWLEASARAEQARRDVERERRLAAAQATSHRDLEAAEASAAVANATLEAARVALEGRGVDPETARSTYLVRAPRAGVLAALTAQLGESVDPSRTLGSIVAPGAGVVRVELPLPGPSAWSIGAATEVRRSDGRRWPARLEGTPASLGMETRRLIYRLRLDAAAGDLPLAGTPLEVRVPLARAIVLPQTALQQIEGVWGVFAKNGDEAAFRPVRKGSELGGDVMVLEGVTPGEEIAVDGAYLLKALWLKRSGGGEAHDH